MPLNMIVNTLKRSGLKILLLIACSGFYMVKSESHQKKTVVACIEGEQRTEVELSCPNGLINILSVQVGHQEVPEDKLVCVPQSPDACMLNTTRTTSLLAGCMGASSCKHVVANPEQDRCGKDVNYVQVELECIPGGQVDAFSVVDICGEIFGKTKSISRTHGYIVSNNFPMPYSPQTLCSCNLTTQTPTASVILKIMDMDLDPHQKVTLASDWLEYTTDLGEWGDGQMLNHLIRNYAVDTNTSAIFLNFRTDGIEEGRGFWLNYEGMEKDGTEVDVKVQCGQYHPPDYKSDIACYAEEGRGELYLSCQDLGVINVLSLIRGYDVNSTLENCAHLHNVTCAEEVVDDEELLKSCMGQIECNPPARATIVEKCGKKSNYMQVLYQCIREDPTSLNTIIDMCGDATKNVIHRKSGYLETLNYPVDYFPDQKCTCRLQAAEENSQVVLSVVDLGLDETDCTQTRDWLEYTRDEQNWGYGVNLCDKKLGQIIHTGAQKVYVNFFSDTLKAGRGAWLKYSGMKYDGTIADLKVICGIYEVGKDLPEEVGGDQPPYAHGPDSKPLNDSTNTGLIAGLTVTAVLMILVIVAMLVYKYRRPSKSDNQLPTGAPPSAINRMDTGYGTLKYPGFSTKKDGHGLPYATLDDDQRSVVSRDNPQDIARISGSNQDTANPDYGTESSTSSNSSEPNSNRSEIAYNNPAFDGCWERDQDMDHRAKNLRV